jgi:Leucine rich repeat N-terminal domain
MVLGRSGRVRDCLLPPLGVLLILLLQTLWIHSVVGRTDPTDKRALLEFKANVISPGGLLDTWVPSTDPCDDTWKGVYCNCSFVNLFAPETICNVTANPDALRVLILDLGTLRGQEPNETLYGTLSPYLGNLTELFYLDLQGNNLRVGAPSRLSVCLSAASECPFPQCVGAAPWQRCTPSCRQWFSLRDARLWIPGSRCRAGVPLIHSVCVARRRPPQDPGKP